MAPAAVALVMALTGCLSLDQEEGAGDGRTNSAPPAQGAVGNAATAGPGKTIAAASFESPAAPGAKVEIGVVELRVTGRLAELTLSITPRVPGRDDTTVYDLTGSQEPNVSLIDTVNLKRYVVVKDSSGKPLQPDYIATRLLNGQASVQTYTFAAPPDGVRTVDMTYAQWPPFRDIPVTR
jgi:hypothetical protein